MVMESLQEKVKKELRTVGINYLDIKIQELFDFANELINSDDLNKKHEIITALNDRISTYQEVKKERYSS